MFTDEQRVNVWQQVRQHGLRAFDRLLTINVLRAAGADLPVGRGPLCLMNMAWLAVASALHATMNFAEVLAVSLQLMRDAENWSHTPLAKSCKPRRKSKHRRKHDPRPIDPGSLTEEAFSQARQKMPLGYWVQLILLLGQNFRAEHGQMLYWGGYRLLAMDGTTLNLDNWKPLREHFGTASNGKKGRTPQARMMMLTFPTVRMPWKYELCPLKRSEKTCAMSLLDGLSPRDLVLMDKGFWSYGIFWKIAFQHAYFAIRLFKSVKFKTVRRRGKNDLLVEWSPSDRKWRDLPGKMKLRVIRYQVPGFRSTAMVTNLLDRRVTCQHWVGLATREHAGLTLDNGLYHRRWEIETTFKEMKTHQGLEGKLRGRTPQGIEFEVAGHVLLYLLVRWLIVEAAAKAGLDPLRLSYSGALHELTAMTPLLLISSPRHVRYVLLGRLMSRVAAHVVPLRPGRHYPRPNDRKVRNKGRGHYKRPSKLTTKKA